MERRRIPPHQNLPCGPPDLTVGHLSRIINNQQNKINMHQINEIFFNYIFFPTAAIAYVVGMWSFIVWTIKTWLKERREKLDAKNKSGGTDK